MESKLPVLSRMDALEKKADETMALTEGFFRYHEKRHEAAIGRAMRLEMKMDKAFKYIDILAVFMTVLAAFTLYCLVKISIMDDHFPVEGAAEPVVEQTVGAQPAAITAVVEEPAVFIPYDVPLDYQLQKYICEVADYYGVPRELVFGVCYAESGYDPDASSCGLMGITNACSAEMELLGVTDLLNPWQNATVGIVVLSDKLDTYDTAEEALMAFNAGNGKAEQIWFSKGIYSTEYSRAVLAEAERVRR